MKENIEQILKKIGENPQREGLQGTPDRVERALKEMTSGYNESPSKHLKLFDCKNAQEPREIIIVRDLQYTSLCEHHLLPFSGTMTIGYLPYRKILGLSKFARIVDVFAKRLQLQEKLTREVFDFLFASQLEPGALFVYSIATHDCVMCRGVKQKESKTEVFLQKGFGINYSDMLTIARGK